MGKGGIFITIGLQMFIVYQYLLTSAGNGVAGPVSAMILSISIINSFHSTILNCMALTFNVLY